MSADDIEFEQRLEQPILDTVDTMLKEAATQEYALRIEIAQLKGLPPPPAPAMLTPWPRLTPGLFGFRLEAVPSLG